MQWDSRFGVDFHAAAQKASADGAGKFNVTMAEMHPSPLTDLSDVSSFAGGKWRWQSWATAMGGAYSMHIRMDIANTPKRDLEDCGRVVTFMQSTDFTTMSPHDELGLGGTEYVLAHPGESYIAYARSLLGDIGLKGITAGTYSFRWFDCVNGTSVEQTGVSVPAGDQKWPKPDNIGRELAVYVRRTDAHPPSAAPRR